MAGSPRRRQSRSPSPYRGRSRSRSQSIPRSRSRSPAPRTRERSRSESRGREEDVINPGNTLYVTGLSSRVTERDLRELFSNEGKVLKCHLVVEPHTNVSRGFAFVTMDSVEDADRCIRHLNQSSWEGRCITVEKSKRGRARTPTPGCYLGLKSGRDTRPRFDRGRFVRSYPRDDYYYDDGYRRSSRYSPPPYRSARDFSPPPRSPYGGRGRYDRSYSPYHSPDRGYGRRNYGYGR